MGEADGESPIGIVLWDSAAAALPQGQCGLWRFFLLFKSFF